MSEERITFHEDLVYRPAGWWTPTVHALLAHLRAAGLQGVPEPIAVADGREILRFVPGDSGAAGWARAATDAGLRGAARLLRDYHHAVRSFVAPPDARWALTAGPAKPGEIICHGDFGPWNIVWRHTTPVGLLDFDLAGPGDPLDDIAYALEYLTPFRDDHEAQRWQGYPAPPDRRRRMEIFAEAYGLPDVAGLTDAVIRRQDLTTDRVRELARLGLEPQRSWVAAGFLDELAERANWTRRNWRLFEPT